MLIMSRNCLHRIAATAAVVVAMTFAACSSSEQPTSTQDDPTPILLDDPPPMRVTSVEMVDSLEREWHQHMPAAYAYTLHWVCYCVTRSTPFVGVRIFDGGGREVRSMKDQHILDSAEAAN